MKTIIALDCSEIKVSDCDHLFLSGYNWSRCTRSGYYKCSCRGTWCGKETHAKPIHWFVAQLMGVKIPDGFTIDHTDRDKSNNQRDNLRVASRNLQQHNKNKQKNKSGYSGVSFNRHCTTNPWQSIIGLSGKNTSLGNFKTAKEASEVYEEAKLKRDKAEEQKVKEILKG